MIWTGLLFSNIVLKIVAFISSDHEQDEVPHQVEQGILRFVVQASVLDALQLVVDTLSYPILGPGGRKNVQRGQRTVAVSIILFQQQLPNFVRRRYYLVPSCHPWVDFLYPTR